MASINQRKSTDICRMSWFLMEMDEGQSKGGIFNGRIVYNIIHAMDLIEGDGTHMYFNRKIRFNWNRTIIEGRVLMASDDRFHIEQQLKQFAKNKAKLSVSNQNLTQQFLIQYKKGNNSVIHAIVHEKEVVWPKENTENSTIKKSFSSRWPHHQNSQSFVCQRIR